MVENVKFGIYKRKEELRIRTFAPEVIFTHVLVTLPAGFGETLMKLPVVLLKLSWMEVTVRILGV